LPGATASAGFVTVDGNLGEWGVTLGNNNASNFGVTIKTTGSCDNDELNVAVNQVVNPEPGSLLVWSLIGLTVLAGRRARTRRMPTSHPPVD
jgi:hypothetical protein